MTDFKRRYKIKKILITTIGIISFGLMGDKLLPKEFKKEYFPKKENTIRDNNGKLMVSFK